MSWFNKYSSRNGCNLCHKLHFSDTGHTTCGETMVSRPLHCIVNVIVVLMCLPVTVAIHPQAHNLTLLAPFSATGALSIICQTPLLLNKWQSRLSKKYADDPKWPFRLEVIGVDVQSDPMQVSSVVQSYLNTSSNINRIVHAILGPEDFLLPFIAGVAAQVGVPLVSGTAALDVQLSSSLKRTYNTSFFVAPPPSANWEVLNTAFFNTGVRTLAWISRPDDHNMAVSQGAANQLQSLGISTIYSHVLSDSPSAAEYYNQFAHIRDNVRPDMLLVNSYQECFRDDMDVLEQLELTNYFPPALVLQNCLETALGWPVERANRYQHVLQPDFIKPQLGGLDFIEDDTPYASEFRPPPVYLAQNLTTLINSIGTQYAPLGSNTSSTQLFLNWYSGATNVSFIYPFALTWACIDVLEAAMYRAAVYNIEHGITTTTAADLMLLLSGMQLRTPAGRVLFDANGVNIQQVNLLTQMASDGFINVLYPPSLARGSTLIYPAPTWSERHYQQQYMNSTTESTVLAITLCCCTFLAAVGVTAVRHRDSVIIRMLHYGHIVAHCVTLVLAILGVVFLWPMDSTQSICNSQWWVVFVPLSFAVSLINMKAYRLSTFIRTTMQPVSFSHSKVLLFSMIAPIITAILVGLAQGIAPNQAVIIVRDPLRPSLNYVECHSSCGAHIVLLVCGLVGHVLFTVRCLYLIRNGLEGFRDGPIIKEAFYLLYTCLVLAAILQQIPADKDTLYAIRCVLVALGAVLFELRIMIDRLMELWIPRSTRLAIIRLISAASKAVQSNNAVTSARVHSINSSYAATLSDINQSVDDTSPVYGNSAVNQDELTIMLEVLQNNSQRSQQFEDFINHSLASESLHFVKDVYSFKASIVDCILNAVLANAVPQVWTTAVSLSKKYIHLGSDEEVNISSSQRRAILSRLRPEKYPSATTTLEELLDEVQSMSNTFQDARSTIVTMLYQNLWTKFRSQETATAMLTGKLGHVAVG